MAPEPTTREAKLIQYLNEAYGKEKELETALKAHISMTTRDAYKKRLREHLKETSAQAKGLERRIKQLGGKAEIASVLGCRPGTVKSRATRALAAAIFETRWAIGDKPNQFGPATAQISDAASANREAPPR